MVKTDVLIPTELNWVKVRAECVLSHVFTQLKYEVEKDVQSRLSFVTETQKKDCIGFTCETLENDAFVVHRNGAKIVSKVEFRLEPSAISVLDAKADTF